jgi:glycosyltransferase involved in cell wall biosynthesis
MYDQITPLIITYNEACNIGRTLSRLTWAKRVVVVDSGSTDATLEILGGYPQVEVVQHRFEDFASQSNLGLEHVKTPWVLSLDADYELSGELVGEIASLRPVDATSGYRAIFIYRIHGRPLRGSLYPPRIVLFRCDQGGYFQDGHAHRLRISGETQPLVGRIYHDDRKPLERWLTSQRIYARQEAERLISRPPATPLDRLRRLAWPAPIAILLYVLFVKGCVLDGWPGWYYALQRAIAEALLALELMEKRFRGAPDRP